MRYSNIRFNVNSDDGVITMTTATLRHRILAVVAVVQV